MNHHPRRQDRHDDRPAFPLEQVVALACRQFVLVTQKAAAEAARYFGDEAVSIRNEIIDVLQHLCAEEWQFRQEMNGEWVDVYRVGVFEDWPDAWIKVSIERPKGYEAVVVISFHEWD